MFLLNACLTVNKGSSGSHKALWSDFTNMVVNYLNDQEHIAWILLGAAAQKYASIIDRERHGVFKAGHPSPINRSGGFFESGVFKRAEEYLEQHGRDFTFSLK